MRLKLFLLLMLTVALPGLAQKAAVSGMVVDSYSGAPIKGVTVMLNSQGLASVTGPSGDFVINKASAGEDILTFTAPGYADMALQVLLTDGIETSVGTVTMYSEDVNAGYLEDQQDMIFDESILDDEDGAGQSINALTGANDNVYYRTSRYNFGPMYFNYRGYDSRYQSVYINGLQFNDLIRGRFNYSTLLGMTSRAFRNATTTMGMDASAYAFGGIAGSTNYNTVTSGYAPGFNGSVAYTNSNYMLRAMATYSTGINKNGWGLTVSAIGRYAPEGVIEGTFYNSAGLFLSLEKEFNNRHSLTLTAFGGPTQRAAASATYQEAYDLAGTNLYNRNWGYQDGKKRSSVIRETFDPTVILNWIFKADDRTTLNTAAAVRWVNYSSSAFSYYNANNPNPDYYKYLPSYWKDNQEMFDLITDKWLHDESYRQIKWDDLYQANYFNNQLNQGLPADKQIGASYILENRHSNQFSAMFNSFINHRLNSSVTLQGGLSFNYTNASFYKTIRDLLGADFWIDIDPYSDQVSSLDPDKLQNDLDNPNRHVTKGDRFGYDYNIRAIQAKAWLQNVINLPQWDINYGLEIGYTQYQRDGHMRNGRAPNNSLGTSATPRFNSAMLKAGATYKLNGRNFFQAHAAYGSQAPIADVVFVSPRVNNNIVNDLQTEKIFSGDLAYIWNYRRFRGSITGYYTVINDATEHFVFYDDNHSTNANFSLEGVKQVYKGVELGMSYKILPSLAVTFAGTYSKAQYKNNPKGTRSFENGMYADTTQTVYLKNYYLGSRPQTVLNLGFDWQAPKNWFFNINGTWEGDSYVNLGIPYHEEFTDLWQQYPNVDDQKAKIAELTKQEKLKDAFSLNLSIGKLVYINRKVSMNFNLNIYNVLNNRNVVTYAYQQSRIYTKTWDPSYYANRYSYAQGIRIFFNVGIRF